MNCYKHPDVSAVAYCRTCGRPLCEACRRPAGGTILCEEHAPQPAAAAPEPKPAKPAKPAGPAAPHAPSPGLAFLLGLLPGVGAIYNGQYAKGLVHVVIFGLLISIMGSSNAVRGFEPLFGCLLAAWYFYMPFEAYHTARKRQIGEPVDEFSSVFPLKVRKRTGVPAGPLVLIALGVLFLLNTMDILRFDQIARYWPVALIGLGAYMLYCRVTGTDDDATISNHEARHGE
jgi:hypothetical protein